MGHFAQPVFTSRPFGRDLPVGLDPAVIATGFRVGSSAAWGWTPAKVNLHLEILGKRPDGYHALETLMLAIDLFDTIEVVANSDGEIRLTCEPAGLPTGPTNLVWKAADLLRRQAGITAGADIRLTKRIPTEAGMGGGSSDAALTLRLLAACWGVTLSDADLLDLAAGLGSDVGFFHKLPAAWCTGRGEIVEPVPMGGRLDLVVVKPPMGLSTAEVYRRLTVPATPVTGTAIRTALAEGDPATIARHLMNRLEEPAWAMRPELAGLARRLTEAGSLGTLLSGSGSSLFGICRNRAHAVEVADRFRTTTPTYEPTSQVFLVRSYDPIETAH